VEEVGSVVRRWPNRMEHVRGRCGPGVARSSNGGCGVGVWYALVGVICGTFPGRGRVLGRGWAGRLRRH